MGLIMVLFGAALVIAPLIFPGRLPGVSSLIVPIFGVIVMVLGALVASITQLYRKTSADQAFVRTGMGGSRVVMDGGTMVVPFIHQIREVNLRTMKLAVNPSGRSALITRDNLRSNVLAQFYIRVQADQSHILNAARSLGENSVNEKSVEELVNEKLISALRAIASQMDLFEIHTKRDEFAEKVKDHVKSDLEANGLLLESVTISELDQTDPTELSDDNVFDAQGKKKITEITTAAIVERNRLDREAERARREKDVQTRQQILELERMQAEAEANQATEIAKVKASKDRESQEALIAQTQAVETAKVNQERAVQTATIARDQALQTAAVERDQAVEVANRQKEIAVAQQETQRALAQQAMLEAQAARAKAEQEVVTVEQIASADREAQKQVIGAKATIEQDKIRKQTEAEVSAYAQVKQAEAEQQAAEKQAEARLQLAEAEAQSRELVARGEKAQQMVPIAVAREQVAVQEAQVEVERKALENKQTYSAAAIEFEIQKLRISAEKDVMMEAARAMGEALSKADLKLFGDPASAAAMVQNLSKGMGFRAMINGFMDEGTGGNGHGATGDGLKALMNTLGDAVKPILQRETGKDVDPGTVEAVVKAVLAAQSSESKVMTITSTEADPKATVISAAPNGEASTIATTPTAGKAKDRA
jgi:uncharacterized membrane protein YqiK